MRENSSANSREESSDAIGSSSDSVVPERIRAALAPFVPKNQDGESEINRYFIPGWHGESLTSKNVKKFNELLDIFHYDAKESFLKGSNFNRRLKLSIFEEFLSYAEYKTCICSELDDYQSFWNEIGNQDSPYAKELTDFINIFSFRVAAIYMLKIRFISVLMEQSSLDFDLKKLVYPNGFLTSVFQKGGRNELKSQALEQSVYSWFKPNEKVHHRLIELREVSAQLNVTEIIKNISIKSENILSKAYYSHALSHKNFGLFLNNLLINFPLWLNTQSNRPFSSMKTTTQNMEILSCKFGGDYLESLALSHWLAQDANKTERWDQILCPVFKRNDFEAGQYWKLFNELQFLTFLAQIAIDKGREPISFVSQVASGHHKNRKQNGFAQKSLLMDDLSLNHSTYDRIVLNITDFPKNNSQHYLIGKIQEQSDFIKDDGFIYVLSSKKLFVPSQKSKVESLLKSFRVDGILTLDDVKGKGEVGSYIYIFSKRKNKTVSLAKQECFSIRLSAELSSFQDYSQLTKMIQDFFIDNLGDVPPLYQKTFGNAKFEFYQDAIVKGRLIHSSSKDSSKITHPAFFNGLMKSCLPLDFFFDIQPVDFGRRHNDDDPLFEFTSISAETNAPYYIIVDKRAKQKTKLEIILPGSLEVKSYEYGHSMCFYFGITPKWPNLNIDAVRDFFTSLIGEQIIDLTFSGENKRVKANLQKLLLPKVFYRHQELPEHIGRGLSLLDSTSEQILDMRPSNIKQQFEAIQRMLVEIGKNYPTEAISRLSNFKRSLRRSLDKFENSGAQKAVNFNNPILKAPLVLSKTYPIYPQNEDVYIEFNNDSGLNHIHSPLQRTKVRIKESEGVETTSLELYSRDTLVISLYSDEEMISFLRFIFDNLHGMPISQLLQGVSVPRLNDLKSIISSFNSLRKTLEEVHAQIPRIFGSLITQSITQS